MAFLYVETNFLMSIVTGRDPEASELLSQTPEHLRLVVPVVCFMEALSAQKDEGRRGRQLMRTLKQEVNQLRRNLTSSHASELRSHLERGLNVSIELLREHDSRLFDAMHQLIRNAESITLTAPILDESRDNVLINDPPDNLILHCILSHAQTKPAESKAFLSGNTRDFGTEDVRRELRDWGIDKSFSKARDALRWASSLPSP